MGLKGTGHHMQRPDKLKSALQGFANDWHIETLSNHSVGHVDFLERVRQSNWLAHLKALPEEERIAVLREAFVTDPPKLWNHPERHPLPVLACWIGMLCLDSQGLREALFQITLAETLRGDWIYAVVKPIGAIRTIDLIFETVRDPRMLIVVLHKFTHTLLPNVAPEDREEVKQHYKKLDIEAREKYRPFSSIQEREEYEQMVERTLEWGFR
jgi:hypothetical protein